MNIKPLGKRVIIKQTKQEEVTKTGILLPETVSKEKPIIGEVIAVGKDVEDIKKGDKVVYEKYSGSEIKDGDDTLLIIEEKHVLGIID